MAERIPLLTGDDLARPAKNLPLQVIRELGRKLHRQLPTSGNWETLAEDLGYEFESIHQFSSLASVRQDITPGESMLRDWVQRSSGCTLFVLRTALLNADRQDCVDYLETELYNKVICMNLMLCIKDEATKQTEHISVRTKGDVCLIESLRHTLEQPITDNYILERNASWTHSTAREFKGRELMLTKKASEQPMEQDPTVDSSNPTLGICRMDRTSEINNTSTRPVSSSRYQTMAFTQEETDILGASSDNQKRSTNDLDRDRTGDGFKRNNFDFNINETERSTINKAETGKSECYSKGISSLFRHRSQYSDELNTDYPMRAKDSNTSSKYRKEANEHIDSSVNEDSDAEYQDPSSPLFTKSTGVDDKVHKEDLQDLYKDFAEEARISVGLKKNDDIHKAESKQLGCENSYPRKASTAVYEDPRAYRPTSGFEDDPVYQYAKDENFKREDSITKLKEISRTESYTHFVNAASDEPERNEISQRLNGQADTTKLKFIHDNTAVKTIACVFIDDDDPEYRDNNACIYNDFQMVSYDDETDKTIKTDSNNSQSTVSSRTHGSSTEQSSFNRTDHTGDTTGILHSSIPLGVDFEDDSEMTYDISNKININSNGTNQSSPVFIKNITSNLTPARSITMVDGTYIDFNNYPQVQGEEQPVHRTLNGSRRLTGNESRHQQGPLYIDGFDLKRVQFANTGRCVSQLEPRQSEYECLNRQTSCPNFEYTSVSHTNTRGSFSTDFSTIAEAFSPSRDESTHRDDKVEDNDKESQMQVDSAGTLDFNTPRHYHLKRNSFPRIESEAHKDKQFKFARHSLPIIRDNAKHSVSTYMARPLPEVPCGQAENTESSRRRPFDPMFKHSDVAPNDDDYKIVIGGKTSRPLLDGSLANDNLFMHYNSELRQYMGWSPKETENTIDKTMEGVKQDRGLYILWYHRTKRNLIITVTNVGSLLHFRVRTKVLDKRLHFFISQPVMLPGVKQLLAHHHDNGLPVGDGHVAQLRLPVCVKYDKIAVSV